MRALTRPGARGGSLGRAGLLALLLAPAGVAAQRESLVDGREDELAVRMPVRLTAGHTDHLMGVAPARGDALYFVGNEHGTTEILVQAPTSSGPRPLFDAVGDHAFPRVSPDGKRIAYISYVRDATGDACVRELEDPNEERCLTGPSTAELEVLWLDGGQTVGVLSRTGLHAGFTLFSYPAGGGAGRALLERDMIGLARSPDGKHLAYVAIEPRRREVGVSFASRVGRGLRLERIGAGVTAAPPLTFEPELPGMSGFPAFSPDGGHLYFSQYLNDTNRDGVIDGSDRSVLVRVGFDATRQNPFAGQRLEQLTSSRWDCHYPSPTEAALLMTCSHGDSLDIYSLPPDGVVPESWDRARLQAELAVSRDLWAKLLIASRIAASEGRSEPQLLAFADMVWLHLGLREYESAQYYAERIGTLAGRDSPRGRHAALLGELAGHRRADVALAQGQLSRAYIEAERRRLDQVHALGQPPAAGDGPSARDLAALARLITMEIASDLGDKATAVAELRAVEVTTLADHYVLHLAGESSLRLFGQLAEREAVLDLQAKLATHPAFRIAERLQHGSDYVDELLRGRDRTERIAAIEAARRRTQDGSELALLLDVERPLCDLSDASQEEVRARIFALYSAEKDAERRRAIALRTVRAASRAGNEFVQYQFTTTWASSVPPDDPQRRYAEELYRAIVVERAYGELGQHNIAEASAYFFQASRNAQALDAHIGFIEAKLQQGGEDLRAIYDKRFEKKTDDPNYLFARAYLAARELPRLQSNEQHGKVVNEVLGLLARVDVTWPRRIEVHQLWGFTEHQNALRTGSRQAAASANSHYLLALDLAHDRPRARATLLQALGMLQASLANHRRALEHFARRASLPFVTRSSELSFQLARSRSFFHAGQPIAAREAAELALHLCETAPELARFVPPALDRLAFSHLAAAEYPAAAQRYQQLLGTLRGPGDTPINRLKALIGQASANLAAGRPEPALAASDRARALLDAHPEVTARGPSSLVEHYTYGQERYAALLAGLRAEALLGLRRMPEAAVALNVRQHHFESFLEESESDDDLLALTQTLLRKGQVERERGNTAEAQRLLEVGLDRNAEFNKRTGSTVTGTSLGLLNNYAELHLFDGVPRQALKHDLNAELKSAYDFMTRYPSPRWSRDRMRFEIYLSLLGASAPSSNP